MALYHKHRPQTFASVIGQDTITQTITNQILTGSPGHAYLFSGPRGVGKTTTARLLAKALNCKNRATNSAEPCNSCRSCEDITASRAIDVIEIDAASHTGVDHVREQIIENAQFKPTSSVYKVFIIDEVHMLSTSAFNALLKTLEEPPKHVLFVLATTELHKLPDTIISRCQRYDFKRLSYELMKSHLKDVAKEEGVKVDADVLDRVIAKSDGCARDGVSLLDQLIATGEKHITTAVAALFLPIGHSEAVRTLLTALCDRDTVGALTALNDLRNSGVHMEGLAADLLDLIRAMIILKCSPDALPATIDLDVETKKQLKVMAQSLRPEEIVRLADLTIQRRLNISESPIPELPLEMLIVEWCESTPGVNPPAISPTPKLTAAPEKKDQKKIEETVGVIKIQDVSAVTEIEVIKATIDMVTVPLMGEHQKQKEAIVATTTEQTPTCTLPELKAHWAEFLQKIEKESTSLSLILKSGKIIGLNGNAIQIEVPYDFHRDTLLQPTYHKKLTTHIQEVVHNVMTFVVSVAEKKIDDEAELQSLAAAFGGEVV